MREIRIEIFAWGWAFFLVAAIGLVSVSESSYAACSSCRASKVRSPAQLNPLLQSLGYSGTPNQTGASDNGGAAGNRNVYRAGYFSYTPPYYRYPYTGAYYTTRQTGRRSGAYQSPRRNVPSELTRHSPKRNDPRFTTTASRVRYGR